MFVNGSFEATGQLKNLGLERLAADPAVVAGRSRLWFNSTDGVVRYSDGTNIHTIASGDGELESFLRLDGTTPMTGGLTLSSDDQSEDTAVTAVSKGYVASLLSLKQDELGYVPVNKAGDAMLGNLGLAGYRILGLPSPVDPNEPARKIDLDNALSGLDFQADILGTSSEFAGVAGRYIFVDDGTLNVGEVTVSENDIIDVDGGGNVVAVAYDVSEAGPGALVWNRAAETFYRWDGTTWGEFGGLSGINSGNGLIKNANVLEAHLGDGLDFGSDEEIIVIAAPDGGIVVDETGLSVDTDVLRGQALYLDGVEAMTGALSLNSADQSAASDVTAVSKGYLDTVAGALESAIDDVTSLVSGATQLFTFEEPDTTFTLEHNLGTKFVHVTVYDENDQQIWVDSVTATTDNAATVVVTNAMTATILVTGAVAAA